MIPHKCKVPVSEKLIFRIDTNGLKIHHSQKLILNKIQMKFCHSNMILFKSFSFYWLVHCIHIEISCCNGISSSFSSEQWVGALGLWNKGSGVQTRVSPLRFQRRKILKTTQLNH